MFRSILSIPNTSPYIRNIMQLYNICNYTTYIKLPYCLQLYNLNYMINVTYGNNMQLKSWKHHQPRPGPCRQQHGGELPHRVPWTAATCPFCNATNIAKSHAITMDLHEKRRKTRGKWFPSPIVCYFWVKMEHVNWFLCAHSLPVPFVTKVVHSTMHPLCDINVLRTLMIVIYQVASGIKHPLYHH